MFDRIISVDWSGAATENDGVDLRVATFDALTGISEILDRPYGRPGIRSWTRAIFRRWIIEQLNPKDPPTIVAMDFGFGLPWGSDQAVFGVNGWRAMIRTIAEMYELNKTARATAQAVNDTERFEGHGPYRFDQNRTDYNFYLNQEIAYYRIAELCSPQAISQWYLGSGGTVGFHTITGLAAINFLIEQREAKKIDFCVWPQECRQPDGNRHIIVESYPSICPVPENLGPCEDDNQRDAWKVLQMLVTKRAAGILQDGFVIPQVPFGRYEAVSFEDQVQFEGWIIGLNGGAQ